MGLHQPFELFEAVTLSLSARDRCLAALRHWKARTAIFARATKSVNCRPRYQIV